MAYQFVNQQSGKAQVTDDTNVIHSLAGINTSTTDANVIISGLTTLLDLVGWTLTDANRIVTQDIEETT